MLTTIVKPMATLILSRKLYLIASLRSVELPSRAQVSIVVYRALVTQPDKYMSAEASGYCHRGHAWPTYSFDSSRASL